jgi:hypothetical protein
VRNLHVIANYLNGNDHIAVDGIYGPDTIAALSKIVHHVPGFNPTDGLSFTEIGLLANVAQTRVVAGEAAEAYTGTLKTVENSAGEARRRAGNALDALGGG